MIRHPRATAKPSSLEVRVKQRNALFGKPRPPAYLRTLGLITYPLYLTHNVIGSALIRTLVEAGLDATTAVLGMLVLVCWFVCAKIEPAVRSALMQTLAHFGRLPQRQPATRRPALARGLRLPLPVPVKANVVA